MNAAGAGVRDMVSIPALNVRSFVADILDLGDDRFRELLLDTEVPLLIVAHSQACVSGDQANCGVR